MKPKVIKSEEEYKKVLNYVAGLMDAEPGSAEEELLLFGLLVEQYEQIHFHFEFPDPIEAIKFEMEQKGLTVKDLTPMIGRSNRVYEVLSRKRSLTLNMVRKLHDNLGIPAESLIKAYH